jgi:DtxR family Mn-dependent transcriptional regulator
MLSLTEENYLKALFHLSTGGSDVSVLDLSNLLAIKMPTVNSMVKKLCEKGLVNYEKYKPLSLTDKGMMEAGLIIRKHRLTEMYLVEKMGFAWDEVHEIAEQVEHIKSPPFFDKIAEILNHPTVDPHGSPIPDRNGISPVFNYLKLNDCSIDQEYVFCAVENSVDSFLKLLGNLDLDLGDILVITDIQEYDKSLKINFKNKSETISYSVAENILVKVNK